MCLTIPKKVVAQKGNIFVLEGFDGRRQKVKSMVDLKVGNYCLTQQNIAVEKIEKNEAQKIIEILKNCGGK